MKTQDQNQNDERGVIVVPDYVYVTKDNTLVVRDDPSAPVYWNDKIYRFICKNVQGRYSRLVFNPSGADNQRVPVYDLVMRRHTGQIRIAKSVDLRSSLETDDKEIERSYYTDIVKSSDEKRYTFGVVYKASSDDNIVEDAHRDYMTEADLQQAQWDYVRQGDRSIFVQHKRPPFGFEKGGEWVDICTLPFPVEGEFKLADGKVEKRTIPGGSVWMGTVWEPWAWPLIKSGQISGYSFGGSAQRLFDDDE